MLVVKLCGDDIKYDAGVVHMMASQIVELCNCNAERKKTKAPKCGCCHQCCDKIGEVLCEHLLCGDLLLGILLPCNGVQEGPPMAVLWVRIAWFW